MGKPGCLIGPLFLGEPSNVSPHDHIVKLNDKAVSNMSPHDHIVKLNDKAVAMFFGWPTEDDLETSTFSTYVNATRDTRDDIF